MNLPERQFDPTIPLYTKGRRPIIDTEDPVLTAFLLLAMRDVYSKSKLPFACPHCGDRNTFLVGQAHARMPRPSFMCRLCQKRFNRLTGTPLARLRHEDKLPAFVRLLSQQLSYAQAARRLSVDYSAIANWVAKFRLWLFQLDPSGKWESRVRLGIKPRPVTPCLRCASTTVRFSGFDSQAGHRRLSCDTCGAIFPLNKVADNQVDIVVTYDPAMATGGLENPSPS